MSVEEYLVRLVEGPAHILQLREKDLSVEELRRWARVGRKICQDKGKLWLVNGAWWIAAEERAAGAHLRSDQWSAELIRRIRENVGEEFIVGCSVHSREEAKDAESAGADYVLLGPVLRPLSKPGTRKPLGWEVLESVAGVIGIPVFALGGLTLEHEAQALGCGAVGIAGISWAHAGLPRTTKQLSPSEAPHEAGGTQSREDEIP